MRLLLLFLLSTSMGALAIEKGGTLYIKAKDVPLLKEPKVGAEKLATLEPGTEVIWLGASGKDKAFHQVVFKGKKGFVLVSALSPSKPEPELEVDPATGKLKPFASGHHGPEFGPSRAPYRPAATTEVAAELIAVEELNKAKATPAALDEKARELNGK